MKAFVHWLIKKKKIQMEDWTSEIETPKVHIAPEMIPDIYQTEKVIEAGTEPGKHAHAGHRKRKALMRFAMNFTVRTGVRGTELTKIRGKDLFISDNDPNSSKVFLIDSKGGTPQWQPLPLDMLDELKKHVNDDSTCNEALKRGAKIVGIPESINMHVHILRKVFGTAVGIGIFIPLGIFLVILGIILTLTLIGAIIGIPMIIAGIVCMVIGPFGGLTAFGIKRENALIAIIN